MNHNIIKRTKIICTIGPASDTYETCKELFFAGMNVMRLNFSHGSYEEHFKKVEISRRLEEEDGIIMPILLDTKGPEIRTHNFVGGQATIERDSIVKISMEEVEGTSTLFSVNFAGLYDDVKIGDRIKLDDGNLTLTIIDKDEENKLIVTKAYNRHTIKNRRGVNCPDTEISMPYLSEKDINDIIWGCKNRVHIIAASFVRTAEDIHDIRKILIEHNRSDIQIMAKIENPTALKNIDSIIEASDSIMIARGDLGVEIPAEEVPVAQMNIIKKCRIAGKPVVTATQMLDSMKSNPNPTRAEVSDVANAVLDSTDAVMLSAESANGEYPVLACSMQAKIADNIEAYLNYSQLAQEAYETSHKNNNDAIANAVANIASLIGASLIISFSRTSKTSRRISKARPCCPILSVSDSRSACFGACLHWGVYPLLVKALPEFIEDMEVLAILKAKQVGLKPGDKVILTGGTPVGSGKSNFMKILKIPEPRGVRL